jgi:hypothetical protein
MATGELTVLDPWVVHAVPDGIYCSHSPAADTAEKFGLLDIDGKNVNELVARFVCASRADSSESGGGDFAGLPFYVGGFLQMTLLQPNRIECWIAHRWPDEIGKIVDPTSGEPLPQFVRDLEAKRADGLAV